MVQSSPPGYVFLLTMQRHGESLSDWPDAADAERIQHLPPEALRILKAYMVELHTNPPRTERPCVWLDLETRECMFYEHRPQICRDLAVGSQGCKSWRKLYQIA